jgi:hypothetical protein
MKELLLNLGNIVGAVTVYFGVLLVIPKVIECKYVNKKR